MSRTVPAAMQVNLDKDTTAIATCVRITRVKDGGVLTFTSNTSALIVDLADGNGPLTYSPQNGVISTALSTNSEMEVDQAGFIGVFNSTSITEEALIAGDYNRARFDIFWVDHQSLSDGHIKIARGEFGNIEITPDGRFSVDFRSQLEVLTRTIGEVYTKDCRADLGDNRCRIPLFPDVVTRGTAFQLGDYVRASNVGAIVSQLFIVNPGAEQGATVGWTVDLGGLQNGAPFTGANSFQSTAVARTEAHQDVAVAASQTTAIDAGERQFEITWQTDSDTGPADENEVLVEFLDSGLSVIDQTKSGMLAFSSYTARIMRWPVPALTRNVRIRMFFRRDAAPNSDSMIDDFTARLLPMLDEITVLNPGAESGTASWTNEVGTLATDGSSLAPGFGSACFDGGTDLDVTASQIIVLPTGDETIIDAGDAKARIAWIQDRSGTPDEAGMILQALDAADAQLATISSSVIVDGDEWGLRELELDLPTLTRKIRVKMVFSGNSGGTNDGRIDGVRAWFEDVNAVTNPGSGLICEDFDDIIYMCVQAGTTAPVDQPLYLNTVGQTTQDGTAEFVAEEAWTRCFEVTAVDVFEPRRKFTVTELTPNSGGPRGGFPDQWFRFGAAFFESGGNINCGMEVKGFLADDGITITQDIELFEAMGRDIAVGDKGRIETGCDGVFETCKVKFLNEKNFVAEPWGKDRDFMMRYPDVRA